MENSEGLEINFEHYSTWYKEESDVRKHIGTSTINPMIKTFLSLLSKNSLILDQGCGLGYYAEQFLVEGHRVDCFDISEEAINKCRRFFTLAGFNSNRFNLWVENYLTFDYPNSVYDAVLDYYSLHFIPHENQRMVMESIFDTLKSGGYFFIANWLIESLRNDDYEMTNDGGILTNPNKKGTRRCFYLWSSSKLKFILTSIGFKIVKSNHPITSIELICQKEK
ncbi:MAG: class I SAM-dependent methyltransferase [Candidatus Heimdallarchaeaceae archaeon]